MRPGPVVNTRVTAAADGTPIAYEVLGRGPVVVLTNGLVTSNFSWGYLLPRLTRRFTVVTWDLKGHGRSGPARSREGVTIEALADDLGRVLEAAGIARATLAGFSMGCQIIFEAYRALAPKIQALAPILGPAGHLFDSALPQLGAGKAIYRVLRHAPRPVLWSLFRGAALGMRLPGVVPIGRALRVVSPETEDEAIAWFAEHFRTVDPRTAARIAVAAQRHDASDLLPRVEVPVLVVSGGADIFAPPRLVADRLERALPRCDRVHIPDGAHTGLFEHHREIGDALEGFLDRVNRARA
ncbi:MAG: alpha/beta hydrolase [Myxococcales bacterium]|nr:alpha/beta hydrolase [Myxococcales bacterium]